MSQYIMILEMIGTVAFAISGALVAFNAHMDLFGIVVLGVITATGGGILRDILLGVSLLPLAFCNPLYVAAAAVTSIIVFIALYFWCAFSWMKDTNSLRTTLLVLDSLGLAIFTVMGVNLPGDCLKKNRFLCVFSGVVTGVGGGLLRDMTVNAPPYIFSKHIYAIASIIGGEICVLLLQAGDVFGNLDWCCSNLDYSSAGSALQMVSAKSTRE